VNGIEASYQPIDTSTLTGVDPEFNAFEEVAQGRPHPILTSPSRSQMPSFDLVNVPAGRYLVMGDNRDNSFDSRFFGFVDRVRILGRATAVVLSVDWSHFRPRWGRFFSKMR
jgi:signal peptidase I